MIARPVAALLLFASAAAAHQPQGDPLPAGLAFGGPFELVDETGRSVRDTDFRGRWLLISFGYTHCPDICPLDVARTIAALDRLGPLSGRVQPLFVTVDPARDTPAVLRRWTAGFSDRLIGLTGSEAQIAAVARAFRVHRRKVVPDPADPGDDLADHGSLTYLMAPDGHFVTLFPHGTSVERMAEVLARYLRGPPAPGSTARTGAKLRR